MEYLNGSMILLGGVVILLCGVFWVSRLLHLMGRPDEDFLGRNDKLIWGLVLVFGGIFGALVYHFANPIEVPRSSDRLRREFDELRNNRPIDPS